MTNPFFKLAMILAFSSLVLMAIPSLVNATTSVQKNNFCTTTTEKEQGSFKQTISCDYWRNSSNITQTIFWGGGGGGISRGIECEGGEFFNYTTWQCEPKPPVDFVKEPPTISTTNYGDRVMAASLMIGVVILLAGVFLYLSRKDKENKKPKVVNNDA